jgi:thioredoxin-dependent peroxiredoxin
MSIPEPGDVAPAIALPDETGAIHTLADQRGRWTILYFYPKDDTPGCTKEACDFRDNLQAFNAAKVRVLGVSPDDPKRHAKFKEKYGLNFTLLSDVEKKLISAYGIWIKKLNYGREYMGVQRSTFIVDKTGKIAKSWNGVRVPGHVEAVLGAL